MFYEQLFRSSYTGAETQWQVPEVSESRHRSQASRDFAFSGAAFATECSVEGIRDVASHILHACDVGFECG